MLCDASSEWLFFQVSMEKLKKNVKMLKLLGLVAKLLNKREPLVIYSVMGHQGHHEAYLSIFK